MNGFFYFPTSVARFVRNTLARASDINDRLDEVSAGFDGVETALAAKAPLASPTFTGTPSAPTPAASDATTKIATMAAVQNVLAGAVTSTLVLSVEVSGSFTVTAGKHHVLTNAAAHTLYAPLSPSVGARFRITVANGRTDNVINWNGANHQGSTDATMTINSAYASFEAVYVNSSYGWALT